MERRRLRSEFAEARGFTALRTLARRLRRAPAEEGVRMSLCATSSTDLLAGLLEAALFLRGVDVELHVADYGLFHAELLDAASPTTRFGPRLTVAVVGPRDVPRWPEAGATADRADRLARETAEYLLEPCRALHERCGTDVVLTNLHAVPERPLGHFGARAPDDRNNFIRRVNVRLGDLAPSFVHLHDVAALSERMGLDHWVDPRLWHHAKQPASPEAQAELAASLAGHLAGLLGRARKCIVVDLDDTLWGGVVGDDGVDGLELGEGSAAGEAYKDFQLYLQTLARRGVVLAVASKNDEDTARAALDHPEMILRLDDFAAFKAGWGPKSSALREIADELGLGLESFVFVDDNPAEREEVRRELPQVAVPELGEDPADYPRLLDRTYAFETGTLTAEDRARASLYRARGASRRLEKSAASHEAFLESLEMTGAVGAWDATSIPRIAQLIGKTNQYNLTTVRLGIAEVESRARDDAWVTRALRLRDRFGDHGLVSVVWGRVDEGVLDLEGWLMSCRVLKRGAEAFLFNHLLEEARARGVETIVGRFRPTERNAVAQGHYDALGFEVDSISEDQTVWRLEVAAARHVATAVTGEVVA